MHSEAAPGHETVWLPLRLSRENQHAIDIAPASGPSAPAIDEVYLRLGASDGIDDDLERCLIENNWITERCTSESSSIQ